MNASIYRGSIFDSHDGRILLITEDTPGTVDSTTIARIRLAGRGKWNEIREHLAANGLTVKPSTGWRPLPGAGCLRAVLVKS